MVAEGRCRDAGADLDAPRLDAERRQPGKRERRMAAGVFPGLEVVADKHRVEPDVLGEAGKLQQLAWSELFGRRLVSELQQRLLLHQEFATSGFGAVIASGAKQSRARVRQRGRDCSVGLLPPRNDKLTPFKSSPAHPHGNAAYSRASRQRWCRRS